MKYTRDQCFRQNNKKYIVTVVDVIKKTITTDSVIVDNVFL